MYMNLPQLRHQIDRIDADIIDLLVQIFLVVANVSKYKKAHKLPCLDAARRAEMLDTLKALAQQKWLSERFVTNLRTIIYKESLRLQKNPPKRIFYYSRKIIS